MPKIQTSCPNCGQPLVAEITQVIDVKENPQLKELLLAGGLNTAQCQVCGFQGQLPVPLVYHDRDNELLLTFTPPEAGKSIEEKESKLAPLLKQITDNLAPEERKGYLFQPQSMLTMNNMVKNILMADGITEEMIEEQQEQMTLLDKLFSQEGDQLEKTIQENKEKITREFFALFAEIAQRILASQDPAAVEKVKLVQDALMKETEVGKQIKAESEEIRAATKSLEALGNNLTRQSLLELIISAPSRERVRALGSLVAQAMDYEFFQSFTEKIEQSNTEDRKELIERRNMLLKISEEIRQQYENRLGESKALIDQILAADSLQDELLKQIGKIDQVFVEALSHEMREAEKLENVDRAAKLAELLQIIQQMTTPPEMKVLERLLGFAEDPDQLNTAIEEIEEDMLPRVIDYLTSIIGNYEEQLESNQKEEDGQELEGALEELREVHKKLLRHSMQGKFSS